MSKSERIYIRANTKLKKSFQDLAEAKKLSQEELLTELIDSYNNKTKELERLEIKLDVLYEYITLLVKGNTNLPTDKDKMQKIIKANSRFKKYIEN